MSSTAASTSRDRRAEGSMSAKRIAAVRTALHRRALAATSKEARADAIASGVALADGDAAAVAGGAASRVEAATALGAGGPAVGLAADSSGDGSTGSDVVGA